MKDIISTGNICEKMTDPLWNDKSYDGWKKKGIIIEADTIEELANKMKVPVDIFLATVNRYNQFVKKGIDEDFGKDPAKLTSITQPPFGAARTGCGLLVTLDGLSIDTNMQVHDTGEKPIPGLYAAGSFI